MLRQKLQSQRRYWIDFSKWETFINDDLSRTFLSMEIIAGGLMEIRKQIQIVNEVYKLHNLPEFYKDARPHISFAWALGDLSKLLTQAVHNEMKKSAIKETLKRGIFTTKFNGIEYDHKLEQALAREFHISLSRTVPIQLHHDSIMTMFSQKLQSQRHYWIDFSKGETY
ncbi:unnamed protein product [Citrullus colocynthis]|uniref:U6 snRNA phosphodiesterase 1 n=1 Tax=Citrullus colocynthis TaxID=252529 RepID=A0ABP0XSV7_9ROSI